MITGERPSNIACSAEKWQNHEELASRLVLEKELHALSQNIKLQEFLLLKSRLITSKIKVFVYIIYVCNVYIYCIYK